MIIDTELKEKALNEFSKEKECLSIIQISFEEYYYMFFQEEIKGIDGLVDLLTALNIYKRNAEIRDPVKLKYFINCCEERICNTVKILASYIWENGG